MRILVKEERKKVASFFFFPANLYGRETDIFTLIHKSPQPTFVFQFNGPLLFFSRYRLPYISFPSARSPSDYSPSVSGRSISIIIFFTAGSRSAREIKCREIIRRERRPFSVILYYSNNLMFLYSRVIRNASRVTKFPR